MRFSILGSGSGGNGAVVAGPDGALLIDAGLSARQIVARLQQVGLEASAVCGVLLTHEHDIEDNRPTSGEQSAAGQPLGLL